MHDRLMGTTGNAITAIALRGMSPQGGTNSAPFSAKGEYFNDPHVVPKKRAPEHLPSVRKATG